MRLVNSKKEFLKAVPDSGKENYEHSVKEFTCKFCQCCLFSQVELVHRDFQSGVYNRPYGRELSNTKTFCFSHFVGRELEDDAARCTHRLARSDFVASGLLVLERSTLPAATFELLQWRSIPAPFLSWCHSLTRLRGVESTAIRPGFHVVLTVKQGNFLTQKGWMIWLLQNELHTGCLVSYWWRRLEVPCVLSPAVCATLYFPITITCLHARLFSAMLSKRKKIDQKNKSQKNGRKTGRRIGGQ